EECETIRLGGSGWKPTDAVADSGHAVMETHTAWEMETVARELLAVFFIHKVAYTEHIASCGVVA
ncbi:hypothetical protein GOP47_0023348, partial [Adiantum capillus-veneris]